MPTHPITINHIALEENPAPFLSNIHFSFTFEAHQALTSPLQWKITYVGSAKDQSYDQILEQFQIDSVELNTSMKFTVECPPPDFEKIPRKELLCVTAIIITVGYKHQQFVRIGYYVHIMPSKELPNEDKTAMSAKQLVTHLSRTILIDKPRITKFQVDWNQLKQQKESSMKGLEKTPIKADRAEQSNSINSISLTSCNEKQSLEANIGVLCRCPLRKEKKIKKESLKHII